VSTAFYRISYVLGFKPWDRGVIPRELAALVEGPKALPPRKAMDIGCGTGTQAIYLARHGWRVTAVDIVDRVLDAARRKAHAAGVSVEWKRGDAARLGEVAGEETFALLFDQGCFHGLPDAARDGYAAGASSIASRGAYFLVAAFAPARRGPLPRGIGRDEIEARLALWDVLWARKEADVDIRLPPFVAAADLTWYLLRKR
jgi:SAM-dependent methyltransferase